MTKMELIVLKAKYATPNLKLFLNIIVKIRTLMPTPNETNPWREFENTINSNKATPKIIRESRFMPFKCSAKANNNIPKIDIMADA